MCDKDEHAEGDEDGEPVPVADREGDRVIVFVTVAELHTVALPDADAELVCDREYDPVGVGDDETHDDPDTEGDPVPLEDRESDRVIVFVTVAELHTVALPDADAELVCDREYDPVGEDDEDIVVDAERDIDKDVVGEFEFVDESE